MMRISGSPSSSAPNAGEDRQQGREAGLWVRRSGRGCALALLGLLLHSLLLLARGGAELEVS